MKILFLQNKGNSYGGVVQVNLLVGNELVDLGYDVRIVSLYNNIGEKINYSTNVKIDVINDKNLWETYRLEDFKKSLNNKRISELIKQLGCRFKYETILKKDIRKLHKYIREYNPDYIITSHYQMLDMVPKEFLMKTYHEQHSSFKNSWSHLKNRETFLKYNDKIKGFIWLSKKTMEEAIEKGLKNNIYIYNAVRFETNERADVINNKKLITIVRLSKEKQINLMIDICNKIFENSKYSDWKLEIYGDGKDRETLEKMPKSKQIKLMGSTDNPKEKLLTASINLNTSEFEGFCLSILEANECGVPTITFDFGESVREEIIDNKTGFIASSMDDYIKKLEKLMDNADLLDKMSIECKNFNNSFRIKEIIKEWDKLFKEE